MTPIVKLDLGQKRKMLLKALRNQIIEGQFKGRQRFPSYEQLGRSVNASKATVQHVISQLQQDGYLYGIERKGIFVAENLPCFNRFALLFERHEDENRFWSNMAQAGRNGEIKQAVPYRFLENPAHENWSRLHDDINAMRIGGAIFGFHPTSEPDLALVNDHRIPKTVFSRKTETFGESVIPVMLSIPEELKLMFSEFKSMNLKRVAILTMGRQLDDCELARKTEEYGIEIDDFMIQSISRNFLESAANVVKLLMNLPESKRPQGLYLADDNLLEHVMRGLVELEPQLRKNLVIVVRSNFPDNRTTALPVRMFGYDSRTILRTLTERLLDWRITRNIDPIILKPKWSL